MAAAIIGKAAFFAPLAGTLPCKGTPPWIAKDNMEERMKDKG
jgi:hypothetical protein